MTFRRFYNSFSEQEKYINSKFQVRFSLSKFFQPFPIQLYQIPFNIIPQLRMAEPSEEAEGEIWWSILLQIFFISKVDSLPAGKGRLTNLQLTRAPLLIVSR